MKKRLTACLAALAATAGISGCGLLGASEREVTVYFPESAGLFGGNDVGVLGVTVGEVTTVEPQGGRVKVTLRITDPDVSIPADAGAAVVSRTVATDRYVELTPVYRGGPKMADGATIPVERTVTPVDFDKVLHTLKKFSDGLTSDEATTNGLRELVNVTADSLDGKGAQLNRALADLSTAVTAVDQQKGDIFGSMRSLDRLSGELAANEATVRRFIQNVADGTDLLASERLELGAALRSLSRAVDDIARFAQANRTELKGTVRDITAVMDSTLESRADLEEQIETLPLAMQNVQRVVTPGQRIRVQLDPTSLAPIAPQIDELCQQLGTVCDVIGVPPSLGGLLGGLSGLLGRTN